MVMTLLERAGVQTLDLAYLSLARDGDSAMAMLHFRDVARAALVKERLDGRPFSEHKQRNKRKRALRLAFTVYVRRYPAYVRGGYRAMARSIGYEQAWLQLESHVSYPAWLSSLLLPYLPRTLWAATHLPACVAASQGPAHTHGVPDAPVRPARRGSPTADRQPGQGARAARHQPRQTRYLPPPPL